MDHGVLGVDEFEGRKFEDSVCLREIRQGDDAGDTQVGN